MYCSEYVNYISVLWRSFNPNTPFKVNASHLSLLQPFFCFFLPLSTPSCHFALQLPPPQFSPSLSLTLFLCHSVFFSLAFGSHPDTHVRRSWCYIMFFFPKGAHSFSTWWSLALPFLPLLPSFPPFLPHITTAFTEASKSSLVSQKQMVCCKAAFRKSCISVHNICATYTNVMRWKNNIPMQYMYLIIDSRQCKWQENLVAILVHRTYNHTSSVLLSFF